MVNHGRPWLTMVNHFGNGQPWSTMVRTMTLSWCLMVDHELNGRPSKTVVTMVYHGHHFAWVPFPLGAWNGLRYFIVALPEPSI